MTISSLIFDMPLVIIGVLYFLAEWASSPLPAWFVDVVNFPLQCIIDFVKPLQLFGVDLSEFTVYIEMALDSMADTPIAIFILLWCLILGGIFTIAFATVDILDRINFLT